MNASPSSFTPTVSISYDGALPEHLTAALPLLRKHGLRATFFVAAENVLRDPVAWRELVAEGHEIASHALYSFSMQGLLPNWTLKMVTDELASSRRFIRDVLGFEPVGFALPGPSTDCAEGDYAAEAERGFRYVRFEAGGLNDLSLRSCRLTAIRPVTWDDEGFERIIGLHPSNPKPMWAVLAFERFADPSVHERALEFVARKNGLLFTAPIATVLSERG